MGLSRMWLGALVVSGVILGVVVVALITTSWGGNDAKVASTDTTARKPVKVVIAGTNDALEPVPMAALRARVPSGPLARSRTRGRFAVTGG